MWRLVSIVDDPGFPSLVERNLEGDGVAVVGEAGTVQAGVTAANELRPGAVLVDVGLPDGNGVVDLAETPIALPWRPWVVLTSTDPEAAREDDVHRAGARAFVAKQELGDVPLTTLPRVP